MQARASQPLRLPQTMRLKSGRDFKRLRDGGHRLPCGCLIGNWDRADLGAQSRLGVITSSKIGGAVVRNRARRLLREAFRLHQHELTEPVRLVLVARHSIAGKTFSQVEADYLSMLRRAKLLQVPAPK